MFNAKEYSYPSMDNFETASNVSDNHSECLSSNLSSLSGLTGYEEELYDLKHLFKLPSSSPHFAVKTSNQQQFEVFEERIKALNAELQNALKLNEKYKSDMCHLERKIELAFHDRFEKLMRHNAQLEAQLCVANDRVCNLLNKNLLECSKRSDNGRVAELEQKITRLEKQDFELNSEIDRLNSEVKRWKKEAEANEVLNGQLKLEIEEMKLDVSTKSSSIEALKSKIVDLHLETQRLKQDNVKANNLLAIASSERDSFKKSEKWYKEQLHQCRAQKSEASEEISRLQSSLVTKERDLDVRNSDLIRLKNNYDELQLLALKEKQNLLKSIDKMKLIVLNNESSKIVAVEDRNLSENYESTIESLTRELESIKEAVSEQQLTFEGINMQNSKLVARNTTLQKTLNDKESFIANLESEKKDLKVTLEILSERLKDSERLLMKVVGEKSDIEVALAEANREKREIEDAVGAIRENFSKFVGNYSKVKEELCEKNQRLLELQNEQLSSRALSEQLEGSNRKIVELEEVSRKLQNERFDFGSRTKQLEGKVAELEKTNQSLQIETENLTASYGKVKKDLEMAHGIKETLESEVMSYQKLAAGLKEELGALKENMAIVTNELQFKDRLIGDLKEETNSLTRNIESFQWANRNLAERLGSSEKSLDDSRRKCDEVDGLNKLLQVENSDLKNKIAKFVTNNCNGFNNRTDKTELLKRPEEEVCAKLGKQNELEGWFLGVLDWIRLSLLEIEAPGARVQNTRNSMPKCPFQWSHGKIQLTQGQLAKIDEVLVSVSSARSAEVEELQRVSFANKRLKHKLSRLKNNVMERLNAVEDRCRLLDKGQAKDFETLQSIKDLKNKREQTQDFRGENLIMNEKLQEEIKQLKIVCKAKELENNERRKRYEVNNRTLLKKVKEHMRGRNSAEKRCSYLQELYNNVFDELNSYKLREDSKDGEIQNLQSACENYKNINVKMKQELLRMEKELSVAEATKACVKCVELQLLRKNIDDLEAKLEICEKQVKEKEALVNNVQIEIQQTLLNNTALQKENKSLSEKVEKLNDELRSRKEDLGKVEAALEKDRTAVEELREKFLEEQGQRSACVMQAESAQQLLQHTEEKNKLLCEEIEVLHCKLDDSSTEISNLQLQKSLWEQNWLQKETHMQTFISNLQSEIEELQNDLASARSDRHFFQRLCSDLKLALQTSVNQSKVLKKHIETLSSESRECTSLPVNLPSPSKYDDAHVNQLLKQSNSPPIEKPLGDLQNCLNSLKKEMMCLRKQVAEKAGLKNC